MSDSIPLNDRYSILIDNIVQSTLKGNISSKEQVYQMLLKDITPGTGEIFERCLDHKFSDTQHILDTQKDELKQAKATRILRALKTIKGEWDRVQKENQVSAIISSALQKIIHAQAGDRLSVLLQIIDPNQSQVLRLEQLQDLALCLQKQEIFDAKISREIQQIAQGITRGIQCWQRLEPHLISWIYQQNQGVLGFGAISEQTGPWGLWAKNVNSPFPKSLFETFVFGNSIQELVARQSNLELPIWLELTIILQYLQRGLVNWFDQQAYDTKAGSKLSISTYLTFVSLWCELANGFNQNSNNNKSYTYGDYSFQVALQILRNFAQQKYFPLYGGIFTSFSGKYLRNALNYLDEPLRYIEGTQEKARILTLLGYSEGARGEYTQANSFHQQALEIARNAGDIPCEIANFNHLSRMYVAQKNYSEAINYSQRALIMARQTGDKFGEANALANLGYSQVLSAQQLDRMEPEVYESAINYLQQGLQLSKKLGDGQSQSLCYSSLGIAHIILEEYQTAIGYLESGFQAAQVYGDVYLQGLNLTYLAEAYYKLQSLDKTILTGSLAIYLLEQIGANEWRQPAGLLSILRGKIGNDEFQKLYSQQRAKIIAIIGVDGYDYILLKNGLEPWL